MNLPLQARQILRVVVPLADRLVTSEATVLSVDDTTLKTSLPQRNGVRLPIQTERLQVTLVSAEAAYTMRCSVLSVGDEELTLTIPLEEDIERVQRREFVRVATELPVEFEVDPASGARPERTRLKDISGGGCAVYYHQELPIGHTVRVTVPLPNEGTVTLTAVVRRCFRMFRPEGSCFVLGVEFLRCEVDRAKLIRYVIWRQAEIKRLEALDPLNFQ